MEPHMGGLERPVAADLDGVAGLGGLDRGREGGMALFAFLVPGQNNERVGGSWRQLLDLELANVNDGASSLSMHPHATCFGQINDGHSGRLCSVNVDDQLASTNNNIGNKPSVQLD